MDGSEQSPQYCGDFFICGKNIYHKVVLVVVVNAVNFIRSSYNLLFYSIL
jgi:hypothetical protein